MLQLQESLCNAAISPSVMLQVLCSQHASVFPYIRCWLMQLNHDPQSHSELSRRGNNFHQGMKGLERLFVERGQDAVCARYLVLIINV